LTKIDEIRKPERTEEKRLTEQESRDYVIEFDKKRFTMEEASKYVETHNEKMEQKAELRKTEGSDISETEIIEQNEELEPADKIRGLLTKLDEIWSTVENRPEILTEDLRKVLTEVGNQWAKKLEQIENAEVPQQDTEIRSGDMEARGLLPWVEVHKSYPYVWESVIESFSELDNLTRRELPEILTREGIGVLMDDARNHFRLLKEVEPRPSTISVEEHAEKLGVDSGKAVEWIIYNEWPSIYSLIENKLPESKSNSTFSRVRDSLEEFEHGAGE